MTDEFSICNKPGLAKNDEPCCRERGHEGECWFWHQVTKHSIHVFTAEGERVMHFSVDGLLDQEEVAALAAYMEWTHKKISEEQEA